MLVFLNVYIWLQRDKSWVLTNDPEAWNWVAHYIYQVSTIHPIAQPLTKGKKSKCYLNGSSSSRVPEVLMLRFLYIIPRCSQEQKESSVRVFLHLVWLSQLLSGIFWV